jgi:serine/threonine-protein kinase
MTNPSTPHPFADTVSGEALANTVSGAEIARTTPSVEVAAPPLRRAKIRCPGCDLEHTALCIDSGEGLAHYCECCTTSIFQSPALVLPEDYRVLRELGRGGMGSVYLASLAGEERAVKVLLPRLAISEESRRSFLQEAQVMQTLSHPRLVAGFGVTELHPGMFCLVMEYVPGKNGAELLQAGPLAPGVAVSLVAQTLEGLDYVHARGFLHHDIKESNLLITGYPGAPEVKIADFGLARPYQVLGKNLVEGERRPTGISGTIPYLAPEVLHGEAPTPAVDLYAAGATLYRLLSGEYPHRVTPGRSHLVAAAQDRPVPLAERRPEVPASLCAVVDRALDRDPSARYASASELRAALLAA